MRSLTRGFPPPIEHEIQGLYRTFSSTFEDLLRQIQPKTFAYSQKTSEFVAVNFLVVKHVTKSRIFKDVCSGTVIALPVQCQITSLPSLLSCLHKLILENRLSPMPCLHVMASLTTILLLTMAHHVYIYIFNRRVYAQIISFKV